MSAAEDPFYIVKEEIQDSGNILVVQFILMEIHLSAAGYIQPEEEQIYAVHMNQDTFCSDDAVDKLQDTFRRYEQLLPRSGERGRLSSELLAGCESIEWQVDELDRAIAVAERDPVRFSIDGAELEKRRRWTASTRNQMEKLRKTVQADMDKSLGQNHSANIRSNGTRRELLRLPNDHTSAKPNQVMHPDNDDFIQSETDRQLLLIKEQDQELDELSASVEILGGVGLTIHEELMGQEKLLEELDQDMDKTSNRLDFVQKKVALVMKKAGAKGQIMLIVFLVILFMVLVLLVFYT